MGNTQHTRITTPERDKGKSTSSGSEGRCRKQTFITDTLEEVVQGRRDKASACRMDAVPR